MSILVLVAIGIVFGYRFIKNKYFSEPSETAISAGSNRNSQLHEAGPGYEHSNSMFR